MNCFVLSVRSISKKSDRLLLSHKWTLFVAWIHNSDFHDCKKNQFKNYILKNSARFCYFFQIVSIGLNKNCYYCPSSATCIILRWFAVNVVKLCKLTARLSGELTNFHNISPLTTSYPPCTASNLSPPACLPLILPLRHFSLKPSIFVLNLCKIYALNFSKTSGEITNFSGEMCWMRWNYLSSPLTPVVKLHKFTA